MNLRDFKVNTQKLGVRSTLKLVKYSRPGNGYSHDQALAKKYLVLGENYTVVAERVDAWNTEYYIEGFQGMGFNSVLFEEINEEVVMKHSWFETAEGFGNVVLITCGLCGEDQAVTKSEECPGTLLYLSDDAKEEDEEEFQDTCEDSKVGCENCPSSEKCGLK